MLWKSKSNEPEKLTPWVIGAFGVILFIFASYLNFGQNLHWGSTDVSATSATGKNPEN